MTAVLVDRFGPIAPTLFALSSTNSLSPTTKNQLLKKAGCTLIPIAKEP